MANKPLILVTNDDGITAPGIKALVEVAKEFGDVVVVAPDKPQSGMGHAITINSTLRINKSNYHNVLEEYSCSGTPVDCVKIAVNKILKCKPTICVSGINHGSNVSISVIYSGTMSAAVEGVIEGIPSVGFSLCDYAIDANFDAAKKVVKKIITQLLDEKTPAATCLNVNIPPLKEQEIKGIKICRQAKANWVEQFDERKDPNGNSYFWLTGKFENFEAHKEDTDVWALDNGYVSVVPVQYDMTNYSIISEIKDWTVFEK